ncbi:MAG: hypothetical protein CMG55_03440 [Candidatus Marinimicrobia bacterium]|nr:hypothetical protein [Candidatus Neomarinimicrobiota bacterium]|tara:strand:- start:308 stop:703 length:396 start_codon:yes stop_codon:yes gene_type:complete
MFLLSFYSYDFGASEKSLKEVVVSSKGNSVPFSYMKVYLYKRSGFIVFNDRWGDKWNVLWPQNSIIPKIGSYASFYGVCVSDGYINKVQNIIYHKGYTLKLYISIMTLVILIILFFKNFELSPHGFNRRIL